MQIGVIVTAAIFVLVYLAFQIVVNRENAQRYRKLLDAYTDLEVKNRQALDQRAQLEQLNDDLQAVQGELIRSNRELIDSRALWERLAITDAMTEIANHRAFQEGLRAEIARAQRYNYRVVLLMMDVDDFKEYNDAFGHPLGDQVLRRVAALLRETVREGDLVARYGGEEFTALLPQTDARHGRVVAERIRNAVERDQSAQRQISVSIGAAEFPIDGADAESLIATADNALYEAKRQGKNRVVFSEDIKLLDK